MAGMFMEMPGIQTETQQSSVARWDVYYSRSVGPAKHQENGKVRSNGHASDAEDTRQSYPGCHPPFRPCTVAALQCRQTSTF